MITERLHRHNRPAELLREERMDSSAKEPMNILIVEDEADFRDASTQWMRRKGHKVAAAASGAEAISLCERQQFDVGIFDMNMPGMSGIELLQRIRESDIVL